MNDANNTKGQQQAPPQPTAAKQPAQAPQQSQQPNQSQQPAQTQQPKPPQQNAQVPQQQPKKEKKQGFFSRLFSKKEKADKKSEKVDTDKAKESDYKPEFKIDFPTDIPQIPELNDPTVIDVTYNIIDPYVDIHVYWDAANNEIAYKVMEPELSEKEKKDLDTLEEGLTELINISFINIEKEEIVIEYLEKNLRILLDEFGIKVTKETFLKFMYYIYRDFIGMDIVEPLLRDYFIEDIECNGINSPIYIVHRKYRNLKTNIVFPDMNSLTQFVEKLAQKCGKYVSYANPLLDGVLPDGSRVNATYTEDVTSKGPTFCITGGKVQLKDGSLMDIRELFERSKAEFGSVMEEGTEIIRPADLKCCGMYGETLEQVEADIKEVMRLPAPEKLVKVILEDGANIEVTTNHLFHTIGKTAKLVEAKDLKEGMFVPVPVNIKADGARYVINVRELLKQYSKAKKICIVANGCIKSLVANQIELAKSSNKHYRKTMAAEYGVHNSYFYEVISRGSSIAYEVLEKICDKENKDFSSLNQIKIIAYGEGKKAKSKAINVPDEVDEDLAYLAGAIISDGHLSKSSIDVSCFEKGFAKAVESKFIEKFGKSDSYYDGNRVYLCNVFTPFFFNKVFEIPLGKKCATVKIPRIIFKSDEKVIASFIKGLFDGDGTCSAGLSYKTKSKELASGLSYLLGRLGIYCYSYMKNGQYKITIPSAYEAVYHEKVGFENQYKAKKLSELIERKIEHKTYINHSRIPAAPILELLKELKIAKTEVAKETNVSYNRLLYYDALAKPLVKKIIELIQKKAFTEKIKVSQLLKLNFINWLVNNEQEYVKIKSVELHDNKDKKPVYDIELEPCKFYIGGDKPLTVFDTIRKFTKEPWTPIKLMDFKTVSPEILAYIWIAIENKSNILVIGGTGSGKTSLLNAIAFFIPPASRIVSIEDTRELNLKHENWLPAVSRAGAGVANITGEKQGEVTLFDLLKESLRQRPDYIIVGEIRGKEAFVLFQGMSTGHPSFGTMHAESVSTVIKRLIMPPINLSPSMVEALDITCIITPAKVNGQDVRRIREINEIVKVGNKGQATINTPFVRDPRKDQFMFKTQSVVFQKIMKRTGMTWPQLLKEFQNRARLLMAMYRQKIFGFSEVQKIINEYYKRPKEILKRFGIK